MPVATFVDKQDDSKRMDHIQMNDIEKEGNSAEDYDGLWDVISESFHHG